MNKKLILILSIISLFFSSYVTIAYPAKPTIIFDQVQYRIGDNVKITLYCEDNIDGFLVSIYYGKNSLDYVEDYDYKYVDAISNSVTITFRASKGATYLTIETWAFEIPSYEGGIPSDGATSEIYISGIPSDSNGETTDDTTTSFDMKLFLVYSLVIIIAILVIVLIIIKTKKS